MRVNFNYLRFMFATKLYCYGGYFCFPNVIRFASEEKDVLTWTTFNGAIDRDAWYLSLRGCAAE